MQLNASNQTKVRDAREWTAHIFAGAPIALASQTSEQTSEQPAEVINFILLSIFRQLNMHIPY